MNKCIVICHVCKTSTSCHVIPMPYVTRYLVNELAAMNIKVTFDVEKISCLCVCLKDRELIEIHL